MSEDRPAKRLRPQFKLRDVLWGMALLAVMLSWYTSSKQSERRAAQLSLRLQHAQSELEMGQSRAQTVSRPSKKPAQADRLFFEAELSGMYLKNVVVQGGRSAFQRTRFHQCDLENSTLSGGVSAFQAAQFDGANLTGARLTGGGASFQFASFENADLSRAVLTGGGSSFQGSSFREAKLIGTSIVCGGAGFQSVDINGAQFQGADLSSVDRYALESCYFQTPPTYDKHTRFPPEFDPVARSWSMVE